MLLQALKLYVRSFSGLSREIWLLSLVMLINRSGTMVIPFLTIFLTKYLDFTLAQSGIVMSCFGVGAVIGNLLGGKLSDRIGPYPVQFWSLIGTGLMFMVLMNMKTMLGFCLAIFVLSIIAESFRPANLASIAAYSKPENRTRSLSLVRLAVNLGYSAGPAIGGLLAAYAGYNWLFMVDGLTCISAAFMFRLMLRKRKAPKAEPVPAEEKQNKKNAALADKTYLWFSFYMFLAIIAFMQIFTTYPVYLKEHFLMNEDHIGFLMSLNGLFIVAFEMPLIYALEKGGFNKVVLVTLGALLFGVGYLVFLVPGIWWGIAIISMLALTIGEMVNFPFANTFAVERTTPQNRGQYMGIFTMTFSLSHIVAPLLGMYVAEVLGYNALWLMMGLLSWAAVAGFWNLRVKARKVAPPRKSQSPDPQPVDMALIGGEKQD